MATTLRVAPIVEGHGEVQALPILLRRIGIELLGDRHIEVAQPIRGARSSFLKADKADLPKAVRLATDKVRQLRPTDSSTLILVLLDADDDCPAELRSEVMARVLRATDVNVSVVLAKVECETWFVASAKSLTDHLMDADDPPNDPEERRAGKSWVADRFRQGRYSERIDQPKLTSKMDLEVCRSVCPSFDKLCRDIDAAFDA